MKLNEALEQVQRATSRASASSLFLVCGCEPLHLPTFLQAHYARRFEGQRLEVGVGVFGDLEGNLERALHAQATAAAVLVEWSDVDSRLGLRSTGSWSGNDGELISNARARLERIAQAVFRLAERLPVAVSGPSLSFPLAGQTSGWQSSHLELELERDMAHFLSRFAQTPRVRVLSPLRLLTLSPLSTRRNHRLDLAAGFPYSVEHASELARGVIQVAYPSPPMKGLITDLDDTLWAGIVGEIGVDRVAWSQQDRAQLHGLYQSVLRQLADAGVLLGVASKNEERVAEAALAREDLLLRQEDLFPRSIHWGPKSRSVSTILETWNVSADAVVVVDDSRMELEEIRSVHPEITCLQFPAKDPAKCWQLLEQLRDLFGRPSVSETDRLRIGSIKSQARFEAEREARDVSSFVANLDGQVVLDLRKDPSDVRRLDLINKTNQWNINGSRLDEGTWLRLLEDESSFSVAVSYRDRYGALGTVGVMAGRVLERTLRVEHWVLSCRAFSRRIEDHMLGYLFGRLQGAKLELCYRPTERNQPLQEFLQKLDAATGAEGIVVLCGEKVSALTRDLPHSERYETE